MNAFATPRGHPAPWWECPACSIPNDGDLERCAKCGRPRPRPCLTPGCKRLAEPHYARCDDCTERILLRAIRTSALERRTAGQEARESVTPALGATPSRPAAFVGANRPRSASGQALVEFVLVLPVMLAMLLGAVDVWRIGYERTRYAESAGVLADAIAANGYTYPSSEFDALADDELARVGCDREALTVTDDGWRVVVGLTCRYHPIAYHALAVPVSVEAVR